MPRISKMRKFFHPFALKIVGGRHSPKIIPHLFQNTAPPPPPFPHPFCRSDGRREVDLRIKVRARRLEIGVGVLPSSDPKIEDWGRVSSIFGSEDRRWWGSLPSSKPRIEDGRGFFEKSCIFEEPPTHFRRTHSLFTEEPRPFSIFGFEDGRTPLTIFVLRARRWKNPPTFDLRARRWKNHPHLRTSASKVEEPPLSSICEPGGGRTIVIFDLRTEDGVEDRHRPRGGQQLSSIFTSSIYKRSAANKSSDRGRKNPLVKPSDRRSGR